MRAVLKSFAAAIAGTALFFSFFMMFSIAATNVLARLHNPNTPLQAPDVVLAPGPWFRLIGLSLSAMVFVVCFVLTLRRIHRSHIPGSENARLARETGAIQ